MTANILAHYRNLIEAAYRRGSSVGITVDGNLYHILTRMVYSEPVDVEVLIEFKATLTSAGYRGSYYEPPAPREWEWEITNIKLVVPEDTDMSEIGGELRRSEIAEIKEWVAKNEDRIIEIADEQLEELDESSTHGISNATLQNAVKKILDGYEYGMSPTRNTCYAHVGSELAKIKPTDATIRLWGLKKKNLIVHGDAITADGQIISDSDPNLYQRKGYELVSSIKLSDLLSQYK